MTMEELPVSNQCVTTYTLETKNLSYTHQNPSHHQFTRLLSSKISLSPPPPKYIIKNVTLVARPGQLTAIAGPSGAGKTTLLEILAGKIDPGKLSGQILVNGSPIDPSTFRRLSGHVSQDDALFPHLTVEETFTYSALFRLPRHWANHRARQVIRNLGLDHVANSRIVEISGGERRRASIGIELVHNPGVLLVDEPTSGLDSSSALHVVSLLRSAAAAGKTVVLTVHQPGARILDLLDNLILVSNGLVVHHGPLDLLESRLRLAGLVIPLRHVNILEFAIEIEIETETLSSSHQETMTTIERGPPRSTLVGPTAMTNFCANSRLDEMLVLGDRFRKNIFRTRELFAARAVQAVIVGSALGTVYMKAVREKNSGLLETRLGFFAFTLSYLLTSSTEALPIFLRERKVLEREVSSGAYRVSSYVAANALVFAPFLLLVGILYSAPVYWLVGLRRDVDGFLYFAVVVWAVVMASNSFTACFSVVVPDFIVGSSVIAGLMGSFFLFSGYFVAREDMPRYWVLMHYLSLFRYPFESMVMNEYGGKRCVEYVGVECVLYGEEYLREKGFREWEKWSHLGVMFGFAVGYRVICFLILWWRGCGARK
ncbi:ABC transporter G family member 10 [Striga hermonthica]|uniref:ABC transporter G family member 10 n=1 Tax=Striga hermonthica TaxID=68872 RepID=A0A9N7R6M7_STRHE|nr:ABC transporter G family member 10 [Striga hermonthica]